MQFKTMTAISALALMLSIPAAFAATDYKAADSEQTGILGDVKSGLRDANEEMRETADDIRAFFIGKSADSKMEPVVIRRNMTAHGLLGEKIINTKGEEVAKVKDIIIDRNGKADLIVVSDGGLLGIGDKVAAFNYNKVLAQQPDGKVVMTLSQDMVDHAADFSYDQNDWKKAKVIPKGSVSINALLKGDVLDSKGKKVANIDNVYLRNAEVSQIIVSFNQKLGVGGNLAALDYDDLQMIRKDKTLHFKLTPHQSAQFKNYKVSVAK
jgi:sporulation protein YlmC with PRC-barrel domain